MEEPPVEQMLLDNAADVAAECTELDEAEASSAQVLFGPVGLGGTTVLPASRALAAAGACPDRGAAAVVAASISAYGPPRDRRRAARLLEKLAESGERLPRWISAIGDVTPRRAAFLTDSWADERSVGIDFERSDGEVRGLGMSVNGSQGTYACHFMYGPSIEVIENPSARQPRTVVRQLGLADARASMTLRRFKIETVAGYLSGAILSGLLPSRSESHAVRSSDRCSPHHSSTMDRARLGSSPRSTRGVSISMRASFSP